MKDVGLEMGFRKMYFHKEFYGSCVIFVVEIREASTWNNKNKTK